MNDEDFKQIKQQWSEILRLEREAFQVCVMLQEANEGKYPKKTEALQKWWRLASRIVKDFTIARSKYGYELLPLPSETFMRLANISDEVANGILSSFIEHAIVPGRPHGLAERKHIAIAIMYIDAARSGEIDDPHPVPTVVVFYNVSRTTVYNWLNSREKYLVSINYVTLPAEELVSQMQNAGRHYAKQGRGVQPL